MGEVARLFLAPGRGVAMEETVVVQAVADRGFSGCVHGRPGSRRQVLLMDEETLGEFSLAAGTVRENITTRGIAIMKLATGQRLLAGKAVLEVTVPCDPCHRMDEIRMGLQRELRGRRGMLCRVVSGGEIRRGDTIQLEATDCTSGGES